MPAEQLQPILRHLQQHLPGAGVRDLTDRQLLERFAHHKHEAAFALDGDLGGRAEERRGRPLDPVPWKDEVSREPIVAEFRQVTAAVAHLHGRSVIHRDIKPSNVLVMEDGSLRLSDFGLAKHLEPPEQSLRYGPMTSAGAVMGTRHYMAPEQEKGQEVGAPGDVYALGILLAELAVGERPCPHTGVSDGSTLQAWKRLNQLPEAVRGFILRLTAAAPEKRPASARVVQQEFEDLVKTSDPPA
jgi:serine/threonine protein kinase